MCYNTTVLIQIVQIIQTAKEVIHLLDIRLEGKLPIYEQLYNGISGMITSGLLKPDEKLPAVREIAKQLGVNPNTVQKAYAQLESAGFIYSIPAKGSYVSAGEAFTQTLRREALEKARAALEEARNNGVTIDEIRGMTAEVWGYGND